MESAYKGIFTVLDELGMPDLKTAFVEHCVQDRTLQYMETEEELKNLLRILEEMGPLLSGSLYFQELKIPLGQCIPIIKLWIKWGSRWNEPDINQSMDRLTSQYKATMVQQAMQATVPTTEAATQTYDEQKSYSNHSPGVIGSGYSHPQGTCYNQYSLVNQMNHLGFTNHISHANQHIENSEGTLSSGFLQQQTPPPPPPQQIFEPQQMWGNNLYNYQPAIEDLGRSGWLGMLNHPMFISSSREVSPIHSPSLPDMMASVHSNDIRPEGHRINSFNKHNDVLDEREDMAIERSLVAEEKQQSYAAALKEKQIASAKAADNRDVRPRSSSVPQPSPPPLSSPPASFSNPPHYIKSMSHTPVIRPKETASTFSKCDEISVESATSGVVGNNFKDIGTASLRSYLEKLMASQEYIEATSKPKSELLKGWSPIDGKHILSARKIQFKPMFIDDKGRMRHGVSVRGADKSEECSRHTVGKAPAYCTFAHSRIGDTLQFICIKCSCEKSRYTYCQDKKDHREYIFNLGPYKNINGEPWKLTT